MSYWYASGSRSGVFSASCVAFSCRPMPAPLMIDSPSAIAAIMPYSMPLCTILTKCPAPDGPQCMYPWDAVEPGSRPGVSSTEPSPGAIVLKIGSSRSTAAASPPIIRQ